MTTFPQLQDKNIAILGFGLEGKSTLRFLMDQKIQFRNVTILDAKDELESPSEIRTIKGNGYLDHLDDYDVIFKSSGIPLLPKLIPYQDKILTQAQLFFDTYPGKVIAVTATKGKSTMVSLAQFLLINAGYRSKLVGNIGTPIFDEVFFSGDQEPDFVVIELSSYMLRNLRKKNYISILGSIFPEHLDRHSSFDLYKDAKLNILKGSEINIVYEPTIQEYHLEEQYKNIVPYGRESRYTRTQKYFHRDDTMLFPIDDRKIPGDHNLENISAIIALADVLKLPDEVLHKTIKEFQGLPHRLQELGEHGGIRRIDDAISTTPESTIQAIKTYGDQIDTIFLGGTDRGYNFDELAKNIHESKIRNIVIFPDSGKRILEALQHFNISTFQLFNTASMSEAVSFAYKHTTQNKICLLSTASPSYSLRENFEEKGNLFQKYIKEGNFKI